MKKRISLPPLPPSTQMPPQAIELEEVVLGALMVDKKAIDEVFHLLKAEFFYDEVHRFIFTAISNIIEEKAGVDLLTVSTELKRMNCLEVIGGDFYLIQLTNKVSSSAHSEFHARIIIQKYILRRIIAHSEHLISSSYHHDPDVFNLIDYTKKYFDDLYQNILIGQTDIENNYELQMTQKVERHNAGKAVGVPTGSHSLDEFLGGYFLGELYIIAGRPGMGKTTFALISAWHIALTGNYAIFFSFEMPRNQLISKLVSMVTNIDYKRIKKGQLSNEELQIVIQANKQIESSKLIIIADIRTIEDVQEKTAEYCKMYKIRAIFFDYIQRCVSRSKMEPRQLVVHITRELKTLAKSYLVALIALSQLSRAVELRDNKRPKLRDLKESSSIEEDADLVGFLYRQAYYDEQEGQAPGYSELFHVEFIIGKGRDTGTDIIHLFMDPIKMFIADYRFDGNYE